MSTLLNRQVEMEDDFILDESDETAATTNPSARLWSVTTSRGQDSPATVWTNMTIHPAKPNMPPLLGVQGTTCGDPLQGLSSIYGPQEKVRDYIDSARAHWPRLDARELVQVIGQWEKLIGLVQTRYAISRHRAYRQVQELRRQR